MNKEAIRKALFGRVPNKLTTCSVIVAATCLLCWAMTVAFVSNTQHATTVIGLHSTPSNIAAQTIRARLADMNANAVNDLLAGGLGSETARTAFLSEVDLLAAEIKTAAQEIDFPDENEPVLAIHKLLPQYFALVERSRTEARHGNPVSASYMRQAHELMESQIIPAAQRLDDVNKAHLDKAANHHREIVWVQISVILILCVALVWFLKRVHREVGGIWHRHYNTQIIVAMLLTLLWGIASIAALYFSSRYLDSAEIESFRRVHLLVKIEAETAGAKADQSMWLHNGAAKVYLDAFKAKTSNLMDPDAVQQVVGLPNREHTARALAGDVISKARQLRGLIPEQLGRMSLPGEGPATIELLVWFAEFMHIDGKVRALEAQGDHDEAVAMCVGQEKDKSVWAYTNMRKALRAALEINQTRFNASIKTSFDLLAPIKIGSGIVLLLVAISSVMALRKRIADW